jgi:hypothetical protein
MAQPFSDNRLVMLGIIHRDGGTASLLSDWLARSAPDVVTIEFSQYGRDFRQSNSEVLKNRVRAVADELSAEGRQVSAEGLDSLLSYIDLPSEYTVAADYSANHHLPFFLIDMDLFSHSKLKEIDALLDRQNLTTLLSDPGPSNNGREKALARLYFEEGIKVFPYTEEMYVRDRYIGDRIALLMTCYRTARFLHICGWQHLCDPCNVYTRFNPAKVFIHDKAFRV